jgi:peptidoglycan/LPS O-acetylase OafA/YrhL
MGKRFGLLILLLIGLYQFVLLIVEYPGVLTFNFPDWLRYLAPPVLRTTLANWAIYFPLGLMFGLNPKFYTPSSKWLVWVIALITLLLYIFGLLDAFKVISAPIARFICPIPLMFVLFAWKRDSIPLVRPLERIGRRSYGIYLTHLIVLTLVMMIFELWVSWIFNFPAIFSLLLLIIGSLVPLFIMEFVASGPTKQVYRYLFG